MKTSITRSFVVLLLIGHSFITFGQILTSELKVRIGSTIIQDATTVEGTVTIDQPAVPNEGTQDDKAHLVLKGTNLTSSDLVGIKFHQVGTNLFSGQIRFDIDGFHFTEGESQNLRSIYAENLFTSGTVEASNFKGINESKPDFPEGLSSNSVISTTVSSGNYTNQYGGAANFSEGLISEKVEGSVVGWTNFSGEPGSGNPPNPAAKEIFENIPQGIYLLTIRGRGVYHAYSTFIIHCYDNHNKGASRLFNTAYQSEWAVNIVWNPNYTFNIFADPTKEMDGRFSLLRLN